MWNEQLVFSLDGGGTVTVTNANIWQGGLTIEQSVSSDGFFEIGSTHVGQMTVTLVDTFEDIDFQNATVVVSMAKDSDTLQQMGIYTVVRSERDNGILGITAYDNMHLLSEPYTTSLSFPSTYGAMANEIVGTTIQFDGSATAVQSAPEFEAGITKREVLGYIAQACGYNVKCDENGQYKFVRFNMSGFSTQGAYHEISSLFDFHHSHYPVVITGAKVIVRTTVTTTDPDTGETTTEEVVSTYTSGTDDYQIVIEGNPLITTANGQLVANTIFATFGGVEFYTGTVSHLSDLSIKASDIMKVTDRTGTTYPMLVSSTTISTGSPQTSQSYAEEAASKYVVQPSIIDRVQTSVRQALLDAKNGQNKANYAARIASNTNQYFWHTSTGTDTGAHITEIPQEEFLADPEHGGGNLLARSNGIAVRDGLTELATFGANGSTIGETTKTHLELDFHSISGVNKEGNVFFFAGDLREANGLATIHERFEPNYTDNTYSLYFSAVSLVSVTVDGTAISPSKYSMSNNVVTIDDSVFPTGDEVAVIIYTTRSQRATAYTLGARNTSATVGGMSVAYGNNVEASGVASFAGGINTAAMKKYDFAIGNNCKASGETSFAGGLGSEADMPRAFAFGHYCYALAYNATVFGYHNSSITNNQLVCGRWNDPTDSELFVVGNGTGTYNPNTDTYDRSNAFGVYGNGNAYASGRLTAGAVQSITPTWATNQSPANYHCVVSAGLCSFFYQGSGGTHSNETLLGTLPTGAKPKSIVFCPCVKGANAYGLIRVETNGNIYLAYISSTSATARLYFNCSFPVV